MGVLIPRGLMKPRRTPRPSRKPRRAPPPPGQARQSGFLLLQNESHRVLAGGGGWAGALPSPAQPTKEGKLALATLRVQEALPEPDPLMHNEIVPARPPLTTVWPWTKGVLFQEPPGGQGGSQGLCAPRCALSTAR